MADKEISMTPKYSSSAKLPGPDIQNLNVKYAMNIFSWLFVRDAIDGEAAVKFKNELYLPMPAAMHHYEIEAPAISRGHMNQNGFNFGTLFQTAVQFNPDYHSNEAYRAYLTRAEFPELPGYVLRGLLGLASNNEPIIELPAALEYLRDNFDGYGTSIVDTFYKYLEEVLSTGRLMSLVNVHNAEMYVISYKAENVEDWKCDSSMRKANWIRVRDGDYDVLDGNEYYEFSANPFKIMKYSDELPDGKEVTPSYLGKWFDDIPAIMMGSLNNDFKVDPIPMYPIANACKLIYHRSADLSQAEFLTCNPMLIGTGIDDDKKPTIVGSSMMYTTDNPQAKVYYTETDTSALEHLDKRIEKLFRRAIEMGAQLLDTAPKSAETAETVRIKQGASTATLLSVVNNIRKGIIDSLKIIAEKKGANPDEIKFSPSTDFIAPMLTAAEIRELVQSWMNDAISHNSLFVNFKRAGIVRDDVEFEDELKRIQDEIVDPNSPKGKRRAAGDAGRGQNMSADANEE